MTTHSSVLIWKTPWSEEPGVQCMKSDMTEQLSMHAHTQVCHSFPSKKQMSFHPWVQSQFSVIFGTQENKICHCFQFFPFYLPWSDGIRCHDLSFLNVEFQASFFTLIKRLFSSSLVSAIRVVSSEYLRNWYFSQQSWFQLVLPPAQRFSWCTLHIS